MGLAALVRKGEVTPLELVEEAINRIERLNPRLNAVTHKLYDQARASCALPLSNGVFAGVPFLIKDLAVGWQGFPVTYSCQYFKDYVAPSDWDIAKKARATGLIPLGKTNVPELGASSSTEPLSLTARRSILGTTKSYPADQAAVRRLRSRREWSLSPTLVTVVARFGFRRP